MIFTHTITTRHPKYWIAATICIILGGAISALFGTDIIYNGLGAGLLLGFLVGLLFLFYGLYHLHRIIVPKEFSRIISNESIICKSNGNLASKFDKENLGMIFINDQGDDLKIYIGLKNGQQVKFPGSYIMSLSTLRKELAACEYPVHDNPSNIGLQQK